MATNKPADARSARKKVLIVDDHPIVRQGLRQLINAQRDLVVCAEAASVPEAAVALVRSRPDIAIVDLSLGTGDGTELCRDIQLHHPELPVLVLSMHDETLYAERALRAGARGYIMKHQPPDQILAAIRRVLAGELVISETMASRMLGSFAISHGGASPSPIDRLSDRELHVFRLLGQGLTVRQIARELALSPKTVEAHREHIKRKLVLRSSVELVRLAIHQNLQTV